MTRCWTSTWHSCRPGRGPNTILATAFDLKAFFEWAGKEPARIRQADVSGPFAYLVARPRPDPGRVAHGTCHQLRHTCLTRLREAGMALEAVQAQAGHRSIETTRIYRHLTDKGNRGFWRTGPGA